ncbi:MAG: hypothetical protein ABFD91_06780 [Anaerohalosphaeraceae bacterium]
MMNILDNIYNANTDRQQSKLKIWRYAGLMLTYKCSAACAFCYYCCDPQKKGLMTVDTAMAAWEGLIRLAGPDARVHLTGGEPFLVFERLVEITQQAQKAGLSGLEYIETNGSWANQTSDIREKLSFLAAHGMEKLKISCDPFHQEFIDIQKVIHLKTIAEEVLGPDRVMVRWQRYLQNPVNFQAIGDSQKQEIYRQALQDDPCRLTGRAAFCLADLLPQYPLTDYRQNPCSQAILGAKGVHIDPHGNVFSGQCSGLVIENLTKHPLDVIWRDFNPLQCPPWKELLTEGPAGLLDEACSHGYSPRPGYASKCHLCTDLRRFFFDKTCFWPIISPQECYHI